jgi:hypothetical protein
MVTPIDATAMAIAMFEGLNLHSPLIRNVRNNNPGNLRPYAEGQVTDADGYRTFPSFLQGWAALVTDVGVKVNHHLQKNNTMLDFFNIYAPGADHNDPHGYAQFVCKWLSDALARPITLASTIGDIYGS